jgi:tetratricopeptide (TPR) repeat protein
LFLQLKTLYPEHPFFIQNSADFYYKNGQFSETAKIIKQQISKNQNSEILQYKYLQALLMLQNYDTLKTAAENAVELFPVNPQPYFYKALSLYFSAKFDDALESFSTAEKYAFDMDDLLYDIHFYTAKIACLKNNNDLFSKNLDNCKKNSRYQNQTNELIIFNNLCTILWKSDSEILNTNFSNSHLFQILKLSEQATLFESDNEVLQNILKEEPKNFEILLFVSALYKINEKNANFQNMQTELLKLTNQSADIKNILKNIK